MSSSKTSNPFIFPVLALVILMASAFAWIWVNHQINQWGGWGIAIDRARLAAQPSLRNHLVLARDELEAGLTAHALRDVTASCGVQPTDLSCAELKGAVLAVQGGHDANIVALAAHQTNAEAHSVLVSLSGSQTTKAQELYVLGLLRASQRLTSTVTQPSVELYLLRSKLELVLHGNRGAQQSLSEAQAALKLDPTSVPALKQALAVSRQTANANLVEQYQHRLKALT